MTSVILGARTLAQLNDNLAAADRPLDEEETRLLDEVSEPDTPDYPYGEKGQPHRRRACWRTSTRRRRRRSFGCTTR